MWLVLDSSFGYWCTCDLGLEVWIEGRHQTQQSSSIGTQESLTQPKQARMKGRQLPQDHPDYSMVAAV